MENKNSSHPGPASGELIRAAWEARENAYAPYSKFRVGAALETEDGTIFGGANIENLSFGLTICAERTAACAAILAGKTTFRRLVVVADTPEPISPCGACRQFLAEFAPGLSITAATRHGKSLNWSLADLLPRPATGILEPPPEEENR
jgi:cytidine deaminase